MWNQRTKRINSARQITNIIKRCKHFSFFHLRGICWRCPHTEFLPSLSSLGKPKESSFRGRNHLAQLSTLPGRCLSPVCPRTRSACRRLCRAKTGIWFCKGLSGNQRLLYQIIIPNRLMPLATNRHEIRHCFVSLILFLKNIYLFHLFLQY